MMWDVVPCTSVQIDQRCGEDESLSKKSSHYTFILKMATAKFAETFVNIRHSTQRAHESRIYKINSSRKTERQAFPLAFKKCLLILLLTCN